MKFYKLAVRSVTFFFCILLFVAVIPKTDALACDDECWYAAHSGPCYADMWGCDERVTVPNDNAWLYDYQIKYVKSKHGKCIILRYYPIEKFSYDGYNLLDRVWEREMVTELARQNGFSLVRTYDGQIGWVKSNLIVSVYR